MAILKRYQYLFPTLTVALSGRVERMFQVLPDQEEGVFIGDMFSDGLFVVELPCQSSSEVTSDPVAPTILLSPEIPDLRCVQECLCVSLMVLRGLCSCKLALIDF